MIPAPALSDCTALVAPVLPEPRVVTGDRETDAALWLRDVCKTARNPAILDRAREAASRIKTPAKELERRYSEWLARQPGAHPFAVALSSIGIADIERQVDRARERIAAWADGMAVFGSLAAALDETPAERMLLRTTALSDEQDPSCRMAPEDMTALFAASVNPATLTAVAAELRYWEWLYRIRWRMTETERPDADSPDDLPIVSVRRDWLSALLEILPPVNHAESVHIADELRAGLIDIGSVDDGDHQARILDHLLRTIPQPRGQAL